MNAVKRFFELFSIYKYNKCIYLRLMNVDDLLVLYCEKYKIKVDADFKRMKIPFCRKCIYKNQEVLEKWLR